MHSGGAGAHPRIVPPAEKAVVIQFHTDASEYGTMRAMKNLLMVLGLAVALAGCDENTGRTTVSLCGDWKFTKDLTATLDASDVAFDDAAWQID